jgi:hypothetical protein
MTETVFDRIQKAREENERRIQRYVSGRPAETSCQTSRIEEPAKKA